MQKIADALGVGESTVQRDLARSPTVGKRQPAIDSLGRKNAGRPKGSGKQPTRKLDVQFDCSTLPFSEISRRVVLISHEPAQHALGSSAAACGQHIPAPSAARGTMSGTDRAHHARAEPRTRR